MAPDVARWGTLYRGASGDAIMKGEESPADRLERALKEHEDRKKAAAKSAAAPAPERERMNALRAEVDALPQAERRAVLDAAGMQHLSAAPRPLEPLRSGRYGAKPALLPVRWSAWLALASVELWEAVLVSMNMEPERWSHDELARGLAQGFHRRFPPTLPTEAFERLSLCRRALSHSVGPLHPQSLCQIGSVVDAMACPVLLAEVAAFLSSAGFTVPDEMREHPRTDVQPKEPTKEEREDRRLKVCEDAGLHMPDSHVGRMPNGIGRLAKADGVARQTFTDDVRAALKRREGLRRAGGRPDDRR